MLIAIIKVLIGFAIPTIGTLISVIFHAAMPLVIMCIGIAILCSAVGVRLQFGFVGAITTAITSGIGYLGRTFISAIGWVLRHVIMWIPAFYAFVRRTLTSMGMASFFASLFAGLATALFIVVLI